ncbi:hypothetical protein [Nocardia sp. alder85J]|uniref:hypothetical protein n=1 Tax=Nocardia sp. alder85J TaxID=2862949 RepID=UPI001CD661C7|nr:hypothetical protein [Nocardia sp. alder85J]MCX4098773.1 hypothetical protein [Nocardia sp. alder85J]
MNRWLWIAVDIVATVAGGVAAVWAWRSGVRQTAFVPDGDQPAFTSTHYSGSWLGLAVLLAIVAGLAGLDLLVRTAVRSRPDRRARAAVQFQR